jgi:hypothetical protein
MANLRELDSLTITLLYRYRGVIEVLFKHNFELRYFLSNSENEVNIQIWVALKLNLFAEKKLLPYVSLGRFLNHSEAYFRSIFQKDFDNVQTPILFSW